MLEVRDLCKSFGGVHVTQNVSFTLKRGERRVILGPNGAGKTTLFNLLVGELKPDSGELLLDGRSIKRMSVSKRASVGLSRSYQKNNLFEEFTIRENLSLAVSAGKSCYGDMLRDNFKDAEVRQLVEETAAQVGLSDRLDDAVKHASYGNRRQLEVGLALATKPKILLMDEPTSGVGPDMIDTFHQLILDLPKDLTVMIIEHDMDLAFDVADKITVLNYGEVVFEGTPSETKQSDKVREIYLGNWSANA